MVKYRSASLARSLAAPGFAVARVRHFRVGGAFYRVALVRVPPGQESDALARLRADPDVESADYNYRVGRADVRAGPVQGARERVERSGAVRWRTVTDPKLSECAAAFEVERLNGERTTCTDTQRGASWQWNLWRVRAPQAWAYADGEGVLVAVVDEGLDLSHPEFAGRVVVPRTGCEVDTVGGDHEPEDSGGHGTHVAGIVAAGVNGQGVAGVAPGARVLPVRALGPLGGTTFTVVSAMLCAAEHGATVLNGSWGGVAYSAVELDALRAVVSAGVFAVFAAGNLYGAGNPRVYPAAFAETVGGAVAVGATTLTDRVASFSSSGPWVTLAAPGTSVYSTLPTSLGGYGFLQGTSMAAPHVAGVAALLRSRDPALSPQRLKAVLTSTAFPPCSGYPRPDHAEGGSCGAYSPGAGAYGYGIVDALAALGALGR